MNPKEIFTAEANRRFNINIIRFDEYLKDLGKANQLEFLETWINSISALYNNDIESLKVSFYHETIRFNLADIITINFNVYQVEYLRGIKETGYDFRAINNSDINICIENDMSCEKPLQLQLLVQEHSLLKHYFIRRIKEINHKPNSENEKNKEILLITGIDINKLVDHLTFNGYFDVRDSVRVKNWFKGIEPKEKIQLNKPANHFISLVADLEKEICIKNAKTFLYQNISNCFTHKNKEIKPTYVEKVMKPKSENRITKEDLANYIDINKFREHK